MNDKMECNGNPYCKCNDCKELMQSMYKIENYPHLKNNPFLEIVEENNKSQKNDKIKEKTCKCELIGDRDDCPSHRIPQEKYF